MPLLARPARTTDGVPPFVGARHAQLKLDVGVSTDQRRGGSQNMSATTVADGPWKIIESHRLSRTQFERWFQNRDVRRVIMEACGSAHHWAR
ncbi:hypothetical protein PG1C_10160 [Rugosibacter aromaticivorans]|uniref:Uncharacterized protein n=1 Tax=Rugosibacter aromaticivorans TaxID=1565605 RepID=A0A0C5JAI8_9PROT|nr:hypothetical protein PG1C_10160 [Rugosibacter aromaticivorans]